MYNPVSQYLPWIGDLLFFKAHIKPFRDPLGTLQYFFDSGIKHIEIAYAYIDSETIITWGANMSGVSFQERKWRDKNIALGRIVPDGSEHINYSGPRMELNKPHSGILREVMEDYHNELNELYSLKYDHVGLMQVAPHQFFEKITGGRWPKIEMLGFNPNLFCSKLVGKLAERVPGWPSRFSCPNEMLIDPNLLTPGNLYTSYQVKIYKPFNETVWPRPEIKITKIRNEVKNAYL